MSRYPITTSVILDGQEAFTTADDYDSHRPVILDGIAINWGRSSVLDQPDVGTCAFVLRQKLDGTAGDILDRVHTGSTVEVWARAEIGADGDGTEYVPEQVIATNLYPDPSFEYATTPTGIPGNSTSNMPNGTVVADTEHVRSGSRSVKITCLVDNGNVNPTIWSGVPVSTLGLDLGDVITLSAWVYSESTDTNANNIAQLRIGGNAMTALQGINYSITPGTWNRISLTSNPITNLSGTITFYLYGPRNIGESAWFDDVGIVKGDSVIDFSGDQAPNGGYDYRWTGAPGASSSEQFVPAITPNEVMTHTEFSAYPDGPLETKWWDHTSYADVPDLEVKIDTRHGRRAAWVGSRDLFGWSDNVVFPPAEYVESADHQPGEIPDAWDHIPKLLPGKQWRMSITALVPPGAAGRLVARAFDDPIRYPGDTDVTVRREGAGTGYVDLIADGEWHTYTATVELPAGYPDQDGAWIAPGLRLAPGTSATPWSEQEGSWPDHPERWEDLSTTGIARVSLTQVGTSARNVLVWAGDVTSLAAQYVSDHDVALTVQAVDPSTRLANDTVGDEPWGPQKLDVRARRIVNLAAHAEEIDLVVDSGIRPLMIQRRDVDRQPVMGLLQDLATSAGAALWVATHASLGSYLWMEDPQTRAAVRRVVIGDDGLVTIGNATRGVVLLSASDLEQDTLQVSQDVTTVITSVDVTWQEDMGQDPESGGYLIEERTVTRTDEDLAAVYGIRNLQIETELAEEADALALADRMLIMQRGNLWRYDGLRVKSITLTRPINELDDTTRIHNVMDLLDGTRRSGQAITLIEMPEWTPYGNTTSLYAEGGAYSLNDGHWSLEITASAAAGQGSSVTWQEMPPEISWADMDLIEWADLYGTAGPE